MRSYVSMAKSRLSPRKDKRKSADFALMRTRNPFGNRYQVFDTRMSGRRMVRGRQIWTCTWDPREVPSDLLQRAASYPILIVDNETHSTTLVSVVNGRLTFAPINL